MGCSGAGVPLCSPSSPPSSSSSSLPPPCLSAKSAGPLCSCAPPYYVLVSMPSGAIFPPCARTYILKPPDNILYLRRRVLIQLLIVSKDNHRDIDGAEDGELVGLLEEAALALEEGDGSAARRSSSAVAVEEGRFGKSDIPIAIVADGFDLFPAWSVWTAGLMSQASQAGGRGRTSIFLRPIFARIYAAAHPSVCGMR